MDALLEGAAPASSFSFGFSGGFGAAAAEPEPPASPPGPAALTALAQARGPAAPSPAASVPPGLAERALNPDQLEKIFFSLDCRTLASACRVSRQWRDACGRVARVPQWISTLSRAETLADAVTEAATEAMATARCLPHACFIFVTASYLDTAGPKLQGLAAALHATIPRQVQLLGATGTSIIGTERSASSLEGTVTPIEIEEDDGPAVSVSLHNQSAPQLEFQGC